MIKRLLVADVVHRFQLLDSFLVGNADEFLLKWASKDQLAIIADKFAC